MPGGQNPVVAELGKKVTQLSIAAAVLTCLTVVYNLAMIDIMMDQVEEQLANSGTRMDRGAIQSNLIATLVMSCAINLLCPACGYLGAKNNDKNCMCWFSACNALTFLALLFGLPRSVGIVALASGLARVAISGASAYFGYELYNKYNEGTVVVVAPPGPAMNNVQVQPHAVV